jgi:hypothetical protein
MEFVDSFGMPNDYKSNGCGAENARFDFVPDTIYGLSIFEACRRHDWAYFIADNKEMADYEFLANMLTIINSHKKWYYPHFLARRRAMSYYEAVVRFGGDAFDSGKKIKIQ